MTVAMGNEKLYASCKTLAPINSQKREEEWETEEKMLRLAMEEGLTVCFHRDDSFCLCKVFASINQIYTMLKLIQSPSVVGATIRM